MYAMLYVNYISIKLEKSKSAPVFLPYFARDIVKMKCYHSEWT